MATFPILMMAVLVAAAWIGQVTGAPPVKLGNLPKSSKFKIYRRMDSLNGDGTCKSTVVVQDPDIATDVIQYTKACDFDKKGSTIVTEVFVIVDGVIYSDEPTSVVFHKSDDTCELHDYRTGVSKTALTGEKCENIKKALKRKISVHALLTGEKDPEVKTSGPNQQNFIMKIINWLWNMIKKLLATFGIGDKLKNLSSQISKPIQSATSKIQESKPKTQEPKQETQETKQS